ncbi:recombinase family protein [Mucilaginibacter gracilis]|uniref:recombinase family protein n=1 Tax=Mucilaginibacter gracilis TaxID=423350 RepID=UPI000EB5AE82|nr:recombinase family protein [Mucilaginibacter gracilis]
MINLLHKFGIEPQSIEQPLDLEIPENKMMLAFYLAAPEVENDRRGLNVFHGIRRAKKEGRWTSSALVGYANLIANGRKYIAPKEPVASAMRKAFKDASEGKFTLREIYRQAKENGITCGYNNFCNILRSPVYCGKIPVPKYKDEEAFLAGGQHEPLVSEAIFYRAQDVLNGNIKGKATSIKLSSDYLLLRGFLDCPKCTRKLTGSASKGQAGQYYHYYHCGLACKWRIKAEGVNQAVDKETKKITIKEEYDFFYRECISKGFRRHSNNGEYSQKHVVDQIKALNARITQARDHFMAGEFTHADFQAVKSQCETEINSLEKKLPDIILSTKMVDQKLTGLLSNLKVLVDRYKHGDFEIKRRIISSIHPQNIGFSGLEHRTNRINE